MHHGVNDFERIDQLVICYPKGAFNMDGIREYEARFVKLVSPILGSRWGILNDYSEFETGGPEVIKRITSQYHWCVENGCQFMAIVTSNPIHEFFAHKTTDSVSFTEVQLFKSVESAREWMDKKLAA